MGLTLHWVENKHKEGKHCAQAWSPGRGDKDAAFSQQSRLWVPFAFAADE